MGFLGFEHSFDESAFVIIPAQIGGTSCGLPGASDAPEKIISASWQIEDWDTELRFDFTSAKFHTTTKIRNLDDLFHLSLRAIQSDKIPVVIGGEHLLTHVVLKALSIKYGKVSAVFFDAHADMFDEFQGNRMSHACALFLSLPFLHDFISVGVRNVSKREIEMIRQLGLRDKFILFEDMVFVDEVTGEVRMDVGVLDRKLGALEKGPIYVSFDFDFLDPAYLPDVSTPEPPGFSFVQALFVLRRVLMRFGREVVGMDFVELCPGHFASEVSAAKLIAKAIAYVRWARSSDPGVRSESPF